MKRLIHLVTPLSTWIMLILYGQIRPNPITNISYLFIKNLIYLIHYILNLYKNFIFNKQIIQPKISSEKSSDIEI
jgi:hypothetical protein